MSTRKLKEFVVIGAICFSGASQASLVNQWTFNDGTANDLVGNAHGSLLGGASIVSGSLTLDGINDYMRTSTINNTLTTKTLMTWVSLDNLQQESGGVLTVENPNSPNIFDSIVYAERTSNQWMTGSDNFSRTIINNGGSPENLLNDEVLLSIVYDFDNSIKLYRDASLYASYTKGSLQTYNSGVADILLGLRHVDLVGQTSTTTGRDAYFAGSINEARVYNTALTLSDIQGIYSEGAVANVPSPATVWLLGSGLIGFFIVRKKTRLTMRST